VFGADHPPTRFNELKHAFRLATRYNKLLSSYLGFFQIVSI
jgi:hypothetical protein